jgi:hypothetical protein
MKRFKLLMLSACLFTIFSIPMSAFAQGNSSISNIDKPKHNVIFSKAEIKDKDLLLERAKKGISDSDISKLPASLKNQHFVLTDNKGNKKPIKTVLTTQLLSEVQTPEGNIQNYALNVISDNKVSSVISPLATGGSQSNDGYDATYGVQSYSTIYYSIVFASPNQMRLDRVTGGWSLLDGSLALSNKSVVYGTTGTGTNSLPVTQSATKYPSGWSFDYSTGFSKYVLAGGTWRPVIGATTKCTISRGGSSWTFSMNNNW